MEKKPRPDMIEQIKELTNRRLVVIITRYISFQEPEKELLKPTKLNLFGLDIRFRYTEELLRKEKESKNFSFNFQNASLRA